MSKLSGWTAMMVVGAFAVSAAAQPPDMRVWMMTAGERNAAALAEAGVEAVVTHWR
ncbi:MAG: hypothetical protein U9R79_12920 [Armatimonadota bacterium]|nr:hypothetical protein [Armatimonadota bacterium]